MNFKQVHPETCLARCLIILLEQITGKKISDEYELELLLFSLKFERENIARGHLEKIVLDFPVQVNWYAKSRIFYDFVLPTKLPKNIDLKIGKFDKKFIDSLANKPFIIYLDKYYLFKREWGLYYRYHYPHFVILNKKIGKDYEIIDPEDGLVRIIKPGLLFEAMGSLYKYLKFSPQIILIK